MRSAWMRDRMLPHLLALMLAIGAVIGHGIGQQYTSQGKCRQSRPAGVDSPPAWLFRLRGLGLWGIDSRDSSRAPTARRPETTTVFFRIPAETLRFSPKVDRTVLFGIDNR